jgi:hypothetical protein
MSFEILGSILEGGAGPAKPTLNGVEYTLVYDEAAEFWVAHLVISDVSGIAEISDSVQFIQDGQPRKYPNLDSLDVVRSFLTVDASGDQGTLSGFQNVTMAPDFQDSTVLVTVNGQGGLEATFIHSDTNSTGTTQCTVGANFACTLSQVVVDVTNGATGTCPLGGVVTHRGELHVACTGARPLTYDGSWTVSLTFDGGDSVDVSAVSGGNVWNATLPCGE